jgi:protein gp37
MTTELVHALGAKENMTPQEKAELRVKIERLESAMMELGEKMELETKHHFSKDVYAREMVLNKDTLVVGKIHKHKNLNILSSGEALVASVDGIRQVKAPYTFVSDPGAKRVIYALTDLVWTTIHGTSETDVDKIEEQFIAKNYSEVAGITGDELKLLEEIKRSES